MMFVDTLPDGIGLDATSCIAASAGAGGEKLSLHHTFRARAPVAYGEMATFAILASSPDRILSAVG